MKSGHFIQLDSLRAVAAIAVLIQHSLPIPGLNIGLVGVKLFFVLSGFLITGILLRERAACQAGVPLTRVLKVFYARRMLRIFPLYYGVLFSALVFQFPNIYQSMPWHLTYTSNICLAIAGDFSNCELALSHFWSLAVEEQFYLLWPAIILLVPNRYLKLLMVSLVALALLSRYSIAIATHSKLSALVATPSCFDSLALGGLMAVTARNQSSTRTGYQWLRPIVPTAALAFIVIVLASRLMKKGFLLSVVFEDFAISIVFAWLIGRASIGFKGVAKRILEFRPLVYLGTISYGIYVYQGFIPELLSIQGWHLPQYHTVAHLFVLPAISIPIAIISWHLFEKPLNNLKRFVSYPIPVLASSDDKHIEAATENARIYASR